MKAYTNINQSKKLAEILPLESADMVWEYQKDRFVGEPDYLSNPQFGHVIDKRDIACWSLAALLEVLPDYTLQTTTDGKVFVVYEGKQSIIISSAYHKPVDACVDMILLLNKRSLI